MVRNEQQGTARYWLGTVPYQSWIFPSPIPSEVAYIKGQEETGIEGGYHHVQVLVVFKKPVRRGQVTKSFGGHWEKSRSAAASEYVWKEDTRVPDTQFEVGALPVQRNEKKDWDRIRSEAQQGNLQAIPSDIYIRCYNQLRRISSDHAVPVPMVRECYVFWGRTGTGKSKLAWEQAGMEAYAKDPQTKWWDGYSNQQHVIIDEFRGTIHISHILRWLDRYPVRVECKGSSLPLNARKVWITSNIDPRNWYLDIDEETKSALLRRLNITHFAYFFTWLEECDITHMLPQEDQLEELYSDLRTAVLVLAAVALLSLLLVLCYLL